MMKINHFLHFHICPCFASCRVFGKRVFSPCCFQSLSFHPPAATRGSLSPTVETGVLRNSCTTSSQTMYVLPCLAEPLVAGMKPSRLTCENSVLYLGMKSSTIQSCSLKPQSVDSMDIFPLCSPLIPWWPSPSDGPEIPTANYFTSPSQPCPVHSYPTQCSQDTNFSHLKLNALGVLPKPVCYDFLHLN